MKQPLTKILFRLIDGEVTAIMPEIPATSENDCTCYAHIGQHSAASLDLLRQGRPATAGEYRPLLRELRQVGYRVRVMRRCNHEAARMKRRREVRES